MTRQTAAPIAHQTLQATSRSAREIANLFTGYDGTEPSGDLNPEYQRGSVWTEDQRIALVHSWLSGFPVPAVIINDRIFGPWPDGGPNGTPTGGFIYSVIDGKQRIETAIAWFQGDLAVPASWFTPEDVETTESTDDGPYVRYTGLTRPGQRWCANRFQLPAMEARVATIQEEASLYLLVNGGGTPQADTDMDNAARVANAAH